MRSALRLLAIAAVFLATSIGWIVLGGVMSNQSSAQSSSLHHKVADLWGQPQAQPAPLLAFEWTTERVVVRTETQNGVERQVKERFAEEHKQDVSVAATRVDAELHLDQRLKGLVWYALYDVAFRGAWSYVHGRPESGKVRVAFRFPHPEGIYDGFTFLVDGRPEEVKPQNGVVEALVPVVPGQRVEVVVAYKSRGLDEWRYVPANGVANLRDFTLRMKTDFTDIDFPPGTLSPSTRERAGAGWDLVWRFEQVVTGHGAGMTMPARVQPGQLAAALSFSAPVSLLFFFVMLIVLARLRGLDLHPVNYVLLAAAFFAFHLLFAYTVDHMHIIPAFALAAATSVVLVTSYLRLVVSARFAFVEAAAAQLVYLVGFSLAHFLEGFTGLAVTVLSILTLFLLMQLTGRIRWGAPGVANPAS